MNIRSSAKALLVRDGKLLVIRCQRRGTEYYTLPGGGQEYQESLAQTVIRECLEETGLSVKVESLAAVQEEIVTDPQAIQSAPEYCHEHMWYFRCRIADSQIQETTHQDLGQTGIQWVPLDEVKTLPILPQWLRECCDTAVSREAVFHSEQTVFLGTAVYEKPVIPGL